MPESEPDDNVNFSDIDLSSTIDYMARNSIARLDMTIENMSVDPSKLGPKRSMMAVLERPTSIMESEPPSPDGLSGVFIVMTAS